MNRERVYQMIRTYPPVWGLCGVLLMVNLILYFWVIQDQHETIIRQNRQYSELRKSWTVAPDIPGRIRTFTDRKASLEQFMNSIPPMTNLSDIARDLGYFIQKENLSAAKIQFTPERKKGLALWKYTALLSISGKYESLKKVLSDIQGSNRLFCIEQLTLTKAKKPDVVNMKVKVATYCR